MPGLLFQMPVISKPACRSSSLHCSSDRSIPDPMLIIWMSSDACMSPGNCTPTDGTHTRRITDRGYPMTGEVSRKMSENHDPNQEGARGGQTEEDLPRLERVLSSSSSSSTILIDPESPIPLDSAAQAALVHWDMQQPYDDQFDKLQERARYLAERQRKHLLSKAAHEARLAEMMQRLPAGPRILAMNTHQRVFRTKSTTMPV